MGLPAEDEIAIIRLINRYALRTTGYAGDGCPLGHADLTRTLL